MIKKPCADLDHHQYIFQSFEVRRTVNCFHAYRSEVINVIEYVLCEFSRLRRMRLQRDSVANLNGKCFSVR